MAAAAASSVASTETVTSAASVDMLVGGEKKIKKMEGKEDGKRTTENPIQLVR